MHPRTRKQLKEKAIVHANSKILQAGLKYDIENLIDVPLLFNLKMTDEFEIENWLQDNLAINNDGYYIEHKRGTNVFRISKVPDTESNNSKMVLNDLDINIEDSIDVPLFFNSYQTLESEIKNWIEKNISFETEEEYYVEHEEGSNLFKVRNKCKNSESVRTNAFINSQDYLNIPILFDLDETTEDEIEEWIIKSIRYWLTVTGDNTKFYLDHAVGSEKFVIRQRTT